MEKSQQTEGLIFHPSPIMKEKVRCAVSLEFLPPKNQQKKDGSKNYKNLFSKFQSGLKNIDSDFIGEIQVLRVKKWKAPCVEIEYQLKFSISVSVQKHEGQKCAKVTTF